MPLTATSSFPKEPPLFRYGLINLRGKRSTFDSFIEEGLLHEMKVALLDVPESETPLQSEHISSNLGARKGGHPLRTRGRLSGVT